MSPNYHVLLIGIDAYDGAPLHGCVNDVVAIHSLLVDRVGVPADRCKLLLAPHTAVPIPANAERPTCARIIHELEDLGTDRVARDDRVFIYYSGHGTRVLTSTAEGGQVAREALVPADFDSGANGPLLWDIKVRQLLGRIADRTSDVTVVLDCCHSGGATRSSEPDTRPRFLELDGKVLTLPSDLAGLAKSTRDLGGLAAPRGGISVEWQTVAACEDDEKALETMGAQGGPAHGLLTRGVLRAMEGLDPARLHEIRWSEIWTSLRALISQKTKYQHPRVLGSMSRRVFGGPSEDGDAGFSVAQLDDGTYELSAGSLCDVTRDARVAVYGPDPAVFQALGSPADLADRRGELIVTSATEAAARAQVAPGMNAFALPSGARGRVVKLGRTPPLAIEMSADVPAYLEYRPGEHLWQVVAPGEEASDAKLIRLDDGSLVLCDDVYEPAAIATGLELVRIPAGTRPDLARAVLDHYWKYTAPLRVARRCFHFAGKLEGVLLDCSRGFPANFDFQAPKLPAWPKGRRHAYELHHGDPSCLVVTNRTSFELHVSVLVSGCSGRVASLGTATIPAGGLHAFWADTGDGLMPFESRLADHQRAGVDRFSIIGTTVAGVDFSRLRQDQSFEDVLAGAGSKDTYIGEPAQRWGSHTFNVSLTR